jgi:predicted metal-binding membrane protein
MPAAASAVVLRRDRAILFGSAAFLAALAWVAMLRGHAPVEGALHPHAHHGGSSGFALAATMWMVMMVAMMLPAVLPWILLFGAAERKREPQRTPLASVLVFTSGYFVVWAAYSMAAAAAQIALARQGALHGPELRTGALVGGALLLGAGLFQLTPLKGACLEHCRTPLSFFLTGWRDGRSGAFRMGVSHGLYCLVCCWALMVLSFALGVMNLVWMAVLTLILCAEKIAPHGRLLSRAFGLFFAAWGLWLITGWAAP